jgi:hypothetical protein
MNGVVARRNNFSEYVLPMLTAAYAEFAELTGRDYGLVTPYRTDGADTVFVSLGCAAENIEAACDYLRDQRNAKVGSIHINVIRPFPEAAVIEALRGINDLEVILFEPAGAPADGRGMASSKVPPMTAGRAALVGLMHRYLGGLMDPFVTLLEVHKLMYFMQEAGQPLRLRYAKAPYGPFAENLGNVLAQVEGHLVAGYRDGGDAPDKQLTLVPGAVDDAMTFLEGEEATRAHFDRVAALVQGFETPFGLELLSTVHWVAKEAPDATPADIVARVHGWGERKRRFSPRQIGLALYTLAGQGWLPGRVTTPAA